MPWDHLPHRNIWKVPKPTESFKLPLVGRFDRPAFHPVQDMVQDRQAAWLQDKPFAGKRLLASKLAQGDDALLSGALRKLRNIVLFHPGDSQLGRALVSKAGSLVGEDVLQRSLKDSISSKAVGTAVKRITDYHRFAQFLVSTCTRDHFVLMRQTFTGMSVTCRPQVPVQQLVQHFCRLGRSSSSHLEWTAKVKPHWCLEG